MNRLATLPFPALNKFAKDSTLGVGIYMHRYPFIFSDERKYRLQRHLLFWFCWWAFQAILYSFVAFAKPYGFAPRLQLSSIEAFFYMGPHIFFSYSLMYWVIPRHLLKGRYVATILSVLLLVLATAVFAAFVGVYVLDFVRRHVLGGIYNPPSHFIRTNFALALLAGLRGALSIGGIAAAIKLMKYWYVKEQRNLQLQKENITSQLQLLKAQVHPHFLFNTLNNIYSHTQDTAPRASMMIMGLSDLLRYILYECNQPLVPLEKELKMLRDYILLEQIRYGNKLDLNIDLPDNTHGLQIAPLLLLPFVENCFKHGASRILEQPWISLHITLEEDWMKMKLLNGKVPDSAPASSNGIGINNVVKRLELLYPQKHHLSIANDEDVFIVNLKLQLEGSKPVLTTLSVTDNEVLHA
jgi:sensor histidine kinase YesM